MKRVLITGGSGFIGSACLPLLIKKGYEVHAVTSNPASIKMPGVKWHLLDLLDQERIAPLLKDMKPTHLLHLAWVTGHEMYWTSLDNFQWVRASVELFRQFSSNHGRRIVVAGTCAEYDWSHKFCSEQKTPLVPKTLYGACKHSLQMMLTAFSNETGIQASWGRLFYIYGPHERPQRLVASAIRSLMNEKMFRCKNSGLSRDFLYVQDAADAFTSLMDSDFCGAMNIASGIPVCLKDVIHKIGVKLDRTDKICFENEAVSSETPNLLVGDVSRLNTELGWSPKYDLNAGIDLTIQWWKQQLKLHKMTR